MFLAIHASCGAVAASSAGSREPFSRQYHPIIAHTRVIDRLPPGDSARYFSVVRVHESFEPKPADELWVFARRASRANSQNEATTALWTHATPHALVRGPRHTFVRDHSSAHNFAPIFEPALGTFVGAGGEYWGTLPAQYNASASGRPTGVHVRRALRRSQVDGGDFGRLTPASVLRGDARGCFEARLIPRLYDRRHGQLACEFDGFLSLALHRDAALLYARANTSPLRDKGRFVQVTRAPSFDGPWSPFRLLEIEGHRVEADNVYFGVVKPNPADGGRTLLGLFPTSRADGRDCFVGIAISCDGARFSALEVLASSPPAYGGRTADHAVDGLVVGADGGVVYAYIHADVPGLTTARHNSSALTDSRLVQLEIPMASLRGFTERVRAESEALRQSCAAPAGEAWSASATLLSRKLPARARKIGWSEIQRLKGRERPPKLPVSAKRHRARAAIYSTRPHELVRRVAAWLWARGIVAAIGVAAGLALLAARCARWRLRFRSNSSRPAAKM